MNKRYKEDSTRGKAIMAPVTYKPDALVQTWVDSRKLAMLSNWLDDSEWVTRNLSEVVRFTIDMVVDRLLMDGEVEKIELTGQAREILDRKYRANLNPGDRGKRNLLHNKILDDRRTKVVEHSDMAPALVSDGNIRLTQQALQVDPEEVEKIMARYKQDRMGIKKQEVDYNALREHGQLVDLPKEETKVKSKPGDWRPRKLTDEELIAKEEEIRRRDEELKEQMGVIPMEGLVKLKE